MSNKHDAAILLSVLAIIVISAGLYSFSLGGTTYNGAQIHRAPVYLFDGSGNTTMPNLTTVTSSTVNTTAITTSLNTTTVNTTTTTNATTSLNTTTVNVTTSTTSTTSLNSTTINTTLNSTIAANTTTDTTSTSIPLTTTISNQSQLTIQDPYAVIKSATVTNATVTQGRTINITIQDNGASGGTQPYTYQWLESYNGSAPAPAWDCGSGNNPSTNLVTPCILDAATVAKLATGAYFFNLSVTDASGKTVIDPGFGLKIVVDLKLSTLVIVNSGSSVVTGTVSGGSGTYVTSWTVNGVQGGANGAQTCTWESNPVTSSNTTYTLDLTKGYTLIPGSNGCSIDLTDGNYTIGLTAVDSANPSNSNSSIASLDVDVVSSSSFPLSWLSTNSYPTNVFTQSCFVYSSDIYCMGGFDYSSSNGYDGSFLNSIYYAPILGSGGLGAWVPTTSYPISVDWSPCTTAGGNVYCFGGQQYPSLYNYVYYAPISSSGGIGAWKSTTSYPLASGELEQQCLSYQGYIYCVGGGGNSTNPYAHVNSVYYSQVQSSGGLGAWMPTNSYPVNIGDHSCVIGGSNIYCVAGATNVGLINAVYYAPILGSGGGLGAWTSATSYPMATGQESCVTGENGIFCMSGDASNFGYYAPVLDSGGIGPWTSTGNYPLSSDSESCAAYSSDIYCVGGHDKNYAWTPPYLGYNSVYYASMVPTPAQTLVSANIVSNGIVIGSLANGATLITNGIAGGMDTLNVVGVITSGGNLPAGMYGFTLQADSAQQAALTTYFNAKSWPSAYYTQINAEIAGSAPFFYFTSDGNGNYKLVDGFQYGLSGGASIQPLLIDSDYPAGTYTYTGSVNGQPETVTLTVYIATSTAVSCASPTDVGGQSLCTITVTPSAASGTVDKFTTTGSGTFASTSCTLSSGSCGVEYTPTSALVSPQTISATYEGDSAHESSSGTASMAVDQLLTAQPSSPVAYDTGEDIPVNVLGGGSGSYAWSVAGTCPGFGSASTASFCTSQLRQRQTAHLQ